MSGKLEEEAKKNPNFFNHVFLKNILRSRLERAVKRKNCSCYVSLLTFSNKLLVLVYFGGLFFFFY